MFRIIVNVILKGVILGEVTAAILVMDSNIMP